MQIVLYLLPFLLLAYYLWINWSSLKTKPLIPVLYIVGILLWLSGMAVFSSNPQYASLVRLAGIVIILLGVVIDTVHYKKKSS
ncbi:MAG TPA: hypothetical protein PKN87_07285 [Syntrophomonadaceae bacterium]|nr:hypothetical protein [Syntrophomonadaceae bacterium]HNX29203.1 hypothetical protein [Syntrophomonadaceae bacterium]HPR92571.1 hypothetical protein [Syntrophomonadaceae bacterium]